MTDYIVKLFVSAGVKERSLGVKCNRERVRKNRRRYEGTAHASSS